jgi:hypothetical protein
MSTMTGKGMEVKPSLGKSLLTVALVTAAILMIPLVAMQFTTEVVWTALDFVAAGILLALTGLVLTFALRKVRTTRGRLTAVAVIGLAFLYCWAEMAVGIFTNLGS